MNFCDRSDRVQSLIKTRQDNGVVNHIGLAYIEIKIEIEIELSRPIESGVVCYENQTGQRCDQFIGLVYNKIKLN